MIRAKHVCEGCEVRIEGEFTETLFELSAIITSFRSMVTGDQGEEFADEAITYAGKMAYAESHEEKAKLTSEFAKWIESYDLELVRKILE